MNSTTTRDVALINRLSYQARQLAELGGTERNDPGGMLPTGSLLLSQVVFEDYS
jgi:hypothetical protein